MTKRKNSTQFWIDHITSYQQSGLSQTEYCRRMKLNVKSFSARKSMLLKSATADDEKGFVKVPLNKKDVLVQKDVVIIRLPNGMELKFDNLPDPSWLSKVIRSMGADDVVH